MAAARGLLAAARFGLRRGAEQPGIELPKTKPVVFVAGDDWRARRLIRAAIGSDALEVVDVGRVDHALGALRARRPAVVVVDERGHAGAGLELAREVKRDPHLASTRVVVLGEAVDAATTAAALGVGAHAYLGSPISPRELVETVDAFVRAGPAGPAQDRPEGTDPEEARRARANVRLALAFRMAESGDGDVAHEPAPRDEPTSTTEVVQQLRLVEDFRHAYRASVALAHELQQAYEQTITALAKAVEARDLYTGGHVERVRRYAAAIARRLGLSSDEVHQLEIGAVLHDVGKIGVPDAVLAKPGPLDDAEWRVMRRHPEIGRDVLAGIGFLAASLDAVRHHHERWDGGGYPGGLSRQSIPVAGRVVAVADAFDAMTSNRPYRRGLPVETAREEIHRARGSGFDPEVVDAFLAAVPPAQPPDSASRRSRSRPRSS